MVVVAVLLTAPPTSPEVLPEMTDPWSIVSVPVFTNETPPPPPRAVLLVIVTPWRIRDEAAAVLKMPPPSNVVGPPAPFGLMILLPSMSVLLIVIVDAWAAAPMKMPPPCTP